MWLMWCLVRKIKWVKVYKPGHDLFLVDIRWSYLKSSLYVWRHFRQNLRLHLKEQIYRAALVFLIGHLCLRCRKERGKSLLVFWHSRFWDSLLGKTLSTGNKRKKRLRIKTEINLTGSSADGHKRVGRCETRRSGISHHCPVSSDPEWGLHGGPRMCLGLSWLTFRDALGAREGETPIQASNRGQWYGTELLG